MKQEIVYSDVNPDSEYDDCRQIEKFGVTEAGFAVEKSPEKIHNNLHQGTTYYIQIGSSKLYLEPVLKGDTKYVRTLSEDSSEDWLIRLPSQEEYRRDQENRRNNR